VSVTAIWSAAASEARRRFGLCFCGTRPASQAKAASRFACRRTPESSRGVTDGSNHTPPAARSGTALAQADTVFRGGRGDGEGWRAAGATGFGRPNTGYEGGGDRARQFGNSLYPKNPRAAGGGPIGPGPASGLCTPAENSLRHSLFEFSLRVQSNAHFQAIPKGSRLNRNRITDCFFNARFIPYPI